MAEQDMEHVLQIHHSWTKNMKNLFQPKHVGTYMKNGSFQRLMLIWKLGHLKVLRKRIDFIMCGQEMRFTSAHATCNLDLGSDIVQ